MMILCQGATFDIATTSGIAQSVMLRFVDGDGAAKDLSGNTIRCAVRGPGAAAIKCEPIDATSARLAWSPLKAGAHAYDLFMAAPDGAERPLIMGEIQAAPRVTPPGNEDVVTIGDIKIIVPDAADGEVKIIDPSADAAERAEAAAQKAETAGTDADTARKDAENALKLANDAAASAQKALAAIPQVDAVGNMMLEGGLTANGTINANGGINIPLTVGAQTGTAAVNRLYAAGMAGVTDIYTQHVYLNTGAITATGTAFTKILIPGQYAQTNVLANTHSTVIHTFTGPHGQWNYSSFAGFSIPYQLTAAGKITVDIGRGSKTTRQDLSLDSYSIIPGNNLAYNTGEILDITFDNVRDTARNGYVIRVREIYCTESTQRWKVKTTTSFIPASGNEPIPYIVNKIIYQQYEPRSYIAGDYGDTYGALWLLTGSGSIQQLWMIATVRGVTTFETGTGFNRIVSDMPGIADGSVALLVGSAERTNYQPGNVNPVYYALAAIAENAIETEETTDFEDINVPIG